MATCGTKFHVFKDSANQKLIMQYFLLFVFSWKTGSGLLIPVYEAIKLFICLEYARQYTFHSFSSLTSPVRRNSFEHCLHAKQFRQFRMIVSKCIFIVIFLVTVLINNPSAWGLTSIARREFPFYMANCVYNNIPFDAFLQEASQTHWIMAKCC